MNHRSASIAVILFSNDVCDCGRLELVEVWDGGSDGGCLEWIVVGYILVVCWYVAMTVAYGLEGMAWSFVMDKGVKSNASWYGLVSGWVWSMPWGEGDNRLGLCWLVNCGTMLMTDSFIVCNFIRWNNINR